MGIEFSGHLTTIVFLPLAGALLILIPVFNNRSIRFIAGATTSIEVVLGVTIFALYDTGGTQYQLIDRIPNWIPIESFRIQYYLGVDGLSTPMVLLTAILGMVAVFSSWKIENRVREYFVWLLVLQTAVLGVFTSLDLILFFLFWELELIPMFFLISVWGSGRKEYSAMKFLIFTFLGGALILIGILAIFFSVHTFDITKIPSEIKTANLILPAGLIFTILFAGFAIKLPVWPLHTWLPDAHTDAPTAVSIILAGVLLKMGSYGMIRLTMGVFPEIMIDAAGIIATLGVINILYGAIVTLRQTDLKRLIAFSSISHMGYILIGLSSVVGVAGTVSQAGLTGAAMQMFTHGTITGLLFLLVGLIYEKAHTRYIPDLGGLAKRMPLVTVSFIVGGLASLGLPGTSGFVSEILIFLGTFPVWQILTGLSAFGIVITAGYILWTIQRCMFGPEIDHFKTIQDATRIEMIPVLILVLTIIFVGIYPTILTNVFSDGVEPIVELMTIAHN